MPESLFAESEQGNIGRQDDLVPAGGPDVAPGGWGPVKGIVKFPGNRRAPSQENDPAIITATIIAYPKDMAQPFVGPITGIALWASGNGLINQAEFDIPVTQMTGPQVLPLLVPPQGGVLLSVPATSLEIRARDDANLRPTATGLGQQDALGGGGALGPVIVSASLGIGTRTSRGHLVRTVWAINSVANGLPDGGSIANIAIPPFASSMRIVRGPVVGALAASPIRFQLGNSFGMQDGGYDVGLGVPCPEIVLSGQEDRVTVTNTSGGGAVLPRVAAIFSLTI